MCVQMYRKQRKIEVWQIVLFLPNFIHQTLQIYWQIRQILVPPIFHRLQYLVFITIWTPL